MIPAQLRRPLFWTHLVAGVVAGLIILVMSVTGILLSYERQILAATENYRTKGDPSTEREPLSELVEEVRKDQKVAPGSLTVSNNPNAAVIVAFGRDDTFHLDPSSGEILGHGAVGLRHFFHFVEDVHRWLGSEGKTRGFFRGVTGACNAAFIVLILTGIPLWWPRAWTKKQLRASTLVNWKAKGRSRDWNWHNALGFWSAPLLLIIALTGLVMSYPWATGMIYRAVGEKAPEPRQRQPEKPIPAESYLAPVVSYENLIQSIATKKPDWQLITLRLGTQEKPQITAVIEAKDAPHPFARSNATLDPKTGEITKWEPFDANSPGRKLRSWVRPIHTGEAGGIVGQTVAMLASLAACVLVWTGLSLAWRRFFKKKSSVSL